MACYDVRCARPLHASQRAPLLLGPKRLQDHPLSTVAPCDAGDGSMERTCYSEASFPTALDARAEGMLLSTLVGSYLQLLMGACSTFCMTIILLLLRSICCF